MKLRSVSMRDFRNLAEVELAPSPHATIAVGPNGQGKTNLLEAIYYLATLRPLRASRRQELVRFGSERASVAGRFELQGAERAIRVEVTSAMREAFVDGKRTASLEDYFGGVSVVAFTPDDLRVVKDGPEGRRAFLDRAVFNRFPAYLKESRAYTRALKNRNWLLRERSSRDYEEAYEQTLATAGARLYVRRRALVAELAPRAVEAFSAIGRIAQPADFQYAPAHLPPEARAGHEAALAAALREALAARRERDIKRGFTSVGPHADDLDVSLGDRSARAYASQGQQRALVLAWKVAEIENLRASLGYLPLLLLDDVSSELDSERNAYLMTLLARLGAQVFLTTTDAALVEAASAADSSWYEVSGGALRPRNR
jgi:DNA replication and repair protein RecF